MGSVPPRVEVLSESERTRVTRLHRADGGTVIRKQPLGSNPEERVAQEVAVLRQLSGVDGVVQLAPEQPEPDSILLDDVHGTALARVKTPVEGTALVNLMLGLARAIAAVHQRGVLHRDISPSNILVADGGQVPWLIDFALATTFAELRPDFSHPREIVGTLPYLAPEQTGRTGRSVDRRSDLYGLGATLYELATGRPPFGTGDPLRLIHDHLTRRAVPPATANGALPPALSETIMHLLEKEPDNRYQTAEALIRDLERVRDGVELVRAGQDDVSLRLTEPSRPVGRDAEIDLLRAAFEGARSGESRGVLVCGESGVGKTALIDELRPIVTAGNGWFTAGKFDRYRRDREHDGVGNAFRGLGRLLLAEPEEQLAEIRQRLLARLGPNAGLAAEVIPEFAALLKVPPDAGDSLTAQVRARQSALEILQAVASRTRPLVFVVDDVQWAGATPLGLLDQLLTGEEEVEGLLTVAVYRAGDVDQTDEVAPLLSRWQHQPGKPEQLRIMNLDRDNLAAMVSEMLHAPPEAVAGLVGPVFQLTQGNPFDTVQLISGLRREGVLRPTEAGWTWDPATLEHRVARERVADFMQSRLDGMPAATRQTLEAMACLGGEVELRALQVATGRSASVIEQRLTPALDDGLLIMVAGRRNARFQHDRLRDIVLSNVPPERLSLLQLRMARRLAAQPALFAVAADQYLAVLDAVQDPAERHRAARLLYQAARQSVSIGESAPAERMLAAAVDLTDDVATLLELRTAQQGALTRLGRLEEADDVYETITRLSVEPYDRVEATRVQISSLTSRNRPGDAIKIGLDLLRELGWAAPAPDELESVIEAGLEWCGRWIDETSEVDDLSRPEVTDPGVLAVGAVISRLMPACFFHDQATMAWLAIAAARSWAERGPTQTLLGAVGHLPWVLVGREHAYRAGYRLMRRLVAVGEARDFEPDLSQVRFLYTLGLVHWFRPLEDSAAEGRRARDGLVRGGDLQTASYTFSTAISNLDLAATVAEYAAEIDAALAFAQRTGNQHTAGFYRPYRWLAGFLRGETDIADAEKLAERAADPVGVANLHISRALAAAILDDPGSLARHSSAAVALRPVIEGTYGVWQASFARSIALADRIRSSSDPAAELAEIDETLRWMAKRATDMPANYRHIVSLIEAERAWAVRDFRTAMISFDSALREAGHRPWHRAYITERLARFMLANGIDHTGWSMLVEAREAYRTWGARAKVEQLDRAYPSLEVPTDQATGVATRRSSITAGAIDMLGILAASRALSSGTTIDALRSKVVELLSPMTGATEVGLLLWNAEHGRWQAETQGEPRRERKPVPQSVVRYVERTREPLIVGDAVRDDRFSRDPYFGDLDTCSVLAVPVLSRGELRAILLLENRLIRDAFPEERLESVMLIAGQLAISLDNAIVYVSMERKVDERTRELAQANERLAELSITDPLTGLANRRRFEESLREEWTRARRTGAPISLAMVDIDNFKQYNDLHGHPAGDRCLQRVASALDRNTRDTDLVARYGGEEFAVIMPNTGSAAAREAAERMRTAVADLGERLKEDQIVTASVGVATLSDAEEQQAEELVERADAALYQAKRAGRNVVWLADGG